MAALDLDALIGDLRSIFALSEAHPPQQISPEDYRKKHGRCPPGYNFDGSACVRIGSESSNQTSQGAPGTPDAQAPVPGQPLAATPSPRDNVASFLGQRSQNAAQAADAAAAALRRQALTPKDKDASIEKYYTGETPLEFAEREYLRGYAANPVTRLVFPDAFDDQVDFVRVFKDSATQIITDFSEVENTDAKGQEPAGLDRLLKRLWYYNSADWTREQGGDTDLARKLFMQHMEAVLKGAGKEWASAPPVLIAVWKDEKKSKTVRFLFSGNERAMILKYLGMPVPVKEMCFKGRRFAMPTAADVLPIQKILDSGLSLAEIEPRVAAMVAKKRGLPPSNTGPLSPITAMQMEAVVNNPEGVVSDLPPPAPKKPQGWVRLPRGGHHLHAANASVQQPTVADKPLPQRFPASSELPQSQPTPVTVAMSVPDQPSEQPSGAPPSEEGKTVLPITNKPWVDHLPGLPESTRLEHLDPKSGEYKAYREKLHEKIRSLFLNKGTSVPKDQRPVALVTMGGPASGKSTVVGVASKNNFVVCDVDSVRDFIPEYQVAVQNRARDAAFLAHHEARDVMQQIRTQAIEDRKNVVLDGTGQHLASYVDMIRRLNKLGYHVQLVMIDTDPEVAWSRQQLRAEQTGRAIERASFDKIYSVVPFNFIPVSNEVSDFEMWDTRGEKPRLVWEKQNGNEMVHDPAFVEGLKAKTGQAAVKAEWRDVLAHATKVASKYKTKAKGL